jgi:tRNA U55 pseudouridine synthase TruB
MLEFRQVDWKGALRGAIQQAPDRRSAIALGGVRAKRVSGLEGEVLLDIVDGRKIVILDFAQLEEAMLKRSLVSCSAV